MSLQKYGLVLFLALLFAGCSSVRLDYKADTINLRNKEFSEVFQAETLYSTHKNLSDINIDINVFSTPLNETLVYEHARLNTAYRFKYNYRYILTHVFDAKKVESLHDEDGLGFYTIQLKDGTPVYAIVKTGTKKSLTMLYGFSKENFTALMNKQTLKRQKASDIKAQDHIRSSWNMRLIIMSILLEQERRRPFKR